MSLILDVIQLSTQALLAQHGVAVEMPAPIVSNVPFGNPDAAKLAAVGNETFRRAIALGYSRVCAQALARQAKREASTWESPKETALRVVRPMHASAIREPDPPDTAA